MKYRQKSSAILALFLLLGVGLTCPATGYALVQEKGGREGTSGNEPPKPRRDRRANPGNENKPRKNVAKTPLPADVTINLDPPDSTVSLNGRDYVNQERNSSLIVRELKPDTYNIIVRKQHYREYQKTVSLSAGQHETINIKLELLPGNLNVSPTVDETEITISSSETGSVVGHYTGRVTNLEVVPGRYTIDITKSGYQPVTREVLIKPTESIYLEPPLEPARVIARQRPRHLAEMSIDASNEGKFIIVTVSGASGDISNPVGTLDVLVGLADRQPASRSVRGSLPGVPCQVDFVRLENIGEFSFKETPGISNQWQKLVLRVKPKDSKRPIHFMINWKIVQSSN